MHLKSFHTKASPALARALRRSLLAGVSAAALSLSLSAAQAQTVNANGASTNDIVTTDGSGNLSTLAGGTPFTGLTFNNGATATFNGPTFNTTVNGDGLTTSGFVTVTNGPAHQVLDGFNLTSTSGSNQSVVNPNGLTVGDGTNTSTLTSTNLTVNTANIGALTAGPVTASNVSVTNTFGDNVQLTQNVGNSFGGLIATANLGAGANNPTTTLTGLGVTGSNNGSQTYNIDSTTGNASFAGTVTSGGLTVTGLTTTNGINNTGNITTDSLAVNSNASIGGNLSVGGSTTMSGTLGVTGLASLNGGASVSNGLGVSGGTTTDTLNVTGTTTTNGLNNTGAFNQNGIATFTNTASANPNQGSTTINGAFANLSSSQGSITLDATQDPVLTVTNGTSTTQIHNGSITSTVAGAGSTNITGGFVRVNGTYTGSVAGLNSGNAAVVVDGGSITNNGAIVNGGFVANGGSTLNGGTTVNGPTQLNGSLAVAPGNNIDMGGNVVHDVATPIAGTDAANKAYVDSTVHRNRQQAFEGTAIALALSQPILVNGQSFAIRGGWGNFEGENAGGVTVAGVIARDWMFGQGSTVVVDGGVGVGTDFNQVGGRAGVTIGFGGCCASLK